MAYGSKMRSEAHADNGPDSFIRSCRLAEHEIEVVEELDVGSAVPGDRHKVTLLRSSVVVVDLRTLPQQQPKDYSLKLSVFRSLFAL